MDHKWKAKRDCKCCDGRGFFYNPFDQLYRCDCYKQTKAYKDRNKEFCVCGNDISTMKGCIKRGPNWYCSKCKNKVTRAKLDQLIGRIKDEFGCKTDEELLKHLPRHI